MRVREALPQTDSGSALEPLGIAIRGRVTAALAVESASGRSWGSLVSEGPSVGFDVSRNRAVRNP